MHNEAGVGLAKVLAVAESVLCGQAVRECEPDGEAAWEFAALADAVEGLLKVTS